MKFFLHATPENKKTILDLLEEQGVSLPCNCHGARSCGGTRYDFPCDNVPKEDLTITLKESFSFSGLSLEQKPDKSVLPDTILIDIGTTTVAMVYYHSEKNTVFHSETFPNPQITYGADVISRIKYDVEFHEHYTLKHAICDVIQEHHQRIQQRFPDICIRQCFIGGNTTMIHLLLGASLSGMAAAPFTPDTSIRLYHKYADTEVFILPWLSAFIGGDILAGLLHLNFDTRLDTCLLADLGTNGELVLCHKGKRYMTSTAAGPAMEGNGLSCGVPAIPSAISDITLTPRMPRLQTIGNKLPSGICGSGAISLFSELLSRGYLTGEGILTSKFPPDGVLLAKCSDGTPIRFTREDVRQMQVAIAAIGAGIATLLFHAGISAYEIDHLYLAGGLGTCINIEKAASTGIFAQIDLSHISSVGNTCLLGLADISQNRQNTKSRIRSLSNNSEEIILANDVGFQKRFIRHMTYASSLDRPPSAES